MDDSLGQHCLAQYFHERLQLYAGLAHPLRQGGSRDGQAGTAKDLFLPVQWKMVSELGHHYVG
ncbi:hypothetical protein D3C75_862230 [compost metagenome]